MGVPAAYALYCGDAVYRGGMGECPEAHADGPCLRCERASVLILPALTAQSLRDLSAHDAGASAFNLGVPLEHLLDPAVVAASLVDECDTYIGEPIMRLLLEPHAGVRELARKISEACPGRQWAASVAPWVDLSVPDFVEILGDDTVFDLIDRQDFDDYDHFGAVLQGLRRALPPYVRTALGDGDLPPALSGHMDGIVLVGL